MTAVQPPLSLPGREQEPCGDEQAFLDLHGPQQQRHQLTERELKALNDTETVDLAGGWL